MPVSTRSGSGLGDSLYLQSIARHFVEAGEQVEVCSNWPDVFRPLVGRVTISPFRRDRINRLAHYTRGKPNPATTQFQDCCLTAGVSGPVDLRLDWSPADGAVVGRLRNVGRPVVIVQLPRHPMGRADGFAIDLLPDCRVIQRVINRIGGQAFIVQVGSGEALYRFDGIDLDLSNRTTVAEMIDIAAVADAFVGYCSFIVPLAESLLKPAFLVWSRRGLNCSRPFISSITPRKILQRPKTSRFVIDDCLDSELEGAVDAFLDQVRGAAALRGEVGGDCGERTRLAG